MHTELTEKQKLMAMAAKYYQGLHWEVKEGDHYTSARDDLELYRVVSIDEDNIVSTEYCNNPGNLSEWNLEDFTTLGFGLMRVYVPEWIFNA